MLTAMIERNKDMENINDNLDTLTGQNTSTEAVDERFLREAIEKLVVLNKVNKFPPSILLDILQSLSGLPNAEKLRKAWSEALLTPQAKMESYIRSEATTIDLHITEIPITAPNLALILTNLTKLATELWLMGKRRFADLAEYTQTHDVRFSNEVGITIPWITYNSPLNFGLQLAQIVPGLADAFMTIVNGLTQRSVVKEKLELENQATEQQIEEARQKAYNEQRAADINLKMMEVELRLRQWEAYNKIGATTDIETGITIMLPIEDEATKSILSQLALPTVLQLSNTKGLELDLGIQTFQKDIPQEDAGQ